MTPADTENINPFVPVDFSKVQIGTKKVEDAIYELGDFKRANPRFGDKKVVLDAIQRSDYNLMRDISNFYYKTSGIYNRLCRYMAYMYRYDWYVTPYINSDSAKDEKVLDGFNKTLMYLDNFGAKKFFGEAALKVLRNGAYYGYITKNADRPTIQELPPKYCRSRFTAATGQPLVEFNMRFFDDYFSTAAQKQKMLEVFPQEFKKGYALYKQNKLPPDFAGDTSGWYLLDAESAIKFNINGEDFPAFISVIPSIIALDEAQGLDRKKMEQQLLKIIIQKMPMDKNGDLIFDVDEARELHNNAVRMLGRAIGIDVLTTFADVEVADMHSTSATNADDKSMDRVKSAIYDQAGVSQMQFNTDGNIALEKSILNDEASMYNLVQQFEQFLNILIKDFNKSPKKIYYKVQILGTTIYNYKDLSKLYKEQTQLGYSKILPQIALGQSQSSILATAHFENDILDLVSTFIPPMQSSTMNADAIKQRNGGNSENKNNGNNASDSGNGRPTKESQGETVTEKTMQNRESAK